MTNQSPQMIVADLNRRLLNKEEVTDEEIIQGIQALRADRESKTKAKDQKVKAKQAEAAKGEDILNNLL